MAAFQDATQEDICIMQKTKTENEDSPQLETAQEHLPYFQVSQNASEKVRTQTDKLSMREIDGENS